MEENLDMTKLFIANLDWNLKQEDLAEVFSKWWEIEEAIIIMDKETRRSKGFGFVKYTNEEDAKKALEEANGASINDREIIVRYAKQRA